MLVFGFFEGGNYPFSHNGKIKENELYGEGNGYDFGARMYDSRLGRWLSVDPLFSKFPHMSTYQFCNNNPIFFVDPDGRKVVPQENFINSKMYDVYLKLLNIDGFKELQKPFSSENKHDLQYCASDDLSCNDFGCNSNIVAMTRPIDLSKWPNSDYSIATNNNSITKFSSYLPSKSWENADQYFDNMTDAGKAQILIHETLHANRKDNLNSSHEEMASSENRTGMITILKNFAKNNNLNLSDQDYVDLSWAGLENTEAYSSYIKGTAEANQTTYEDELKKSAERISGLIYNQQKGTYNEQTGEIDLEPAEHRGNIKEGK